MTRASQTFGAYDRDVTFENEGGVFYIGITGEDGTETWAAVESKEITRMAHWIIKEFGRGT